jgi:hypothetical protein
MSSTDVSRAWTLSSPVTHGFRHSDRDMWTGFTNNRQSSWLHRSRNMLFVKTHEKRIGAFGSWLYISDFSIGHNAWDLASKFPTLVSHPINCCFTCWIPGYLPQFPCLRLWLSWLSRPGRSLLRSDGVILLVDSLYVEATEAVKSETAFSASFPELIWILGKITSNSEAMLWNRSQPVNLSTWFETFLVLTRSSKWNTIGGWSESKMSKMMTVTVGYSCAQQYRARHHFTLESNECKTVAEISN